MNTKRIFQSSIVFSMFMGLVCGKAQAQTTMPINYYDYYTMSMGDTKIAVLNSDPKSNALFLHNPAGLSYVPKKKKGKLLRLPFNLMMRRVNPRRQDIYKWGKRVVENVITGAEIIYALSATNDWNDINNLTQDELYENLINPTLDMKQNTFYGVYYDEIGYLLQGYYELYSGEKTLPKIYLDHPKFKDHMVDQQQGIDEVKSNFSNTEIIFRLDTRSTFGAIGGLLDKAFKLDGVLRSALSWDFGISGFWHPRYASLFKSFEGPYTPYWQIDLEADLGYSLGVAKKFNLNTGFRGKMPVSLGFRYNRLYRFALDSYLTPSTILSSIFSSGAVGSEDMLRALGDDVIDKMVLGTAGSFDAGILIEPPDIPLLLGMVIRDIGGSELLEAEVGTDSSINTTGKAVGTIPHSFNIGVSYRTTTDIGDRDLLVAIDIRDMGGPVENFFLKLHLGGEYEMVKDSVWVRAGINQGYITYGVTAMVKVLFAKLYFECSKYEGEQFGTRMPGVHTTDPYYTYNLGLRLKVPLPIKLKAQENEVDTYF